MLETLTVDRVGAGQAVRSACSCDRPRATRSTTRLRDLARAPSPSRSAPPRSRVRTPAGPPGSRAPGVASRSDSKSSQICWPDCRSEACREAAHGDRAARRRRVRPRMSRPCARKRVRAGHERFVEDARRRCRRRCSGSSKRTCEASDPAPQRREDRVAGSRIDRIGRPAARLTFTTKPLGGSTSDRSCRRGCRSR